VVVVKRANNDDFSKQQKVAWHEALEYTFDEGIEAETKSLLRDWTNPGACDILNEA
jgi:hypothetical protein